ncbi:uncharacterized protein LOC132316189 [Cornus florida]|uniref:uncharacterized protein LOC132316189 n=1 Tax=Cornus florida TaxID=4283 RepID=UPI00289C3D4B|nr:uncharacterized protein LOC132316189 [Cornus florida]
MTTAFRILAYGYAVDHYDEYIKIGKSTTIKCLKAFCNAIVAVYAEEYMRPPNEADIARLLEEGEQRGFPGMLGSIDCMHWKWKNCRVEWQGTHRGLSGKNTLILEAVASQDLWIWHAFFRMLGLHNDINVLDHSSVFNGIINGQLPPVNYVVNEHHYRIGYYLSDGIYPKWATLMQTIPHPTTTKEKLFAQRQEAARKDVGWAFGVLQIKWTPPPENAIPIPTLSRCPSVLAAHISSRQLQIRNRETNTRLRNDLVENLWNRYADEDV